MTIELIRTRNSNFEQIMNKLRVCPTRQLDSPSSSKSLSTVARQNLRRPRRRIWERLRRLIPNLKLRILSRFSVSSETGRKSEHFPRLRISDDKISNFNISTKDRCQPVLSVATQRDASVRLTVSPPCRNCSVSKAETASRQGEITEKFRWMHGEEELRQIRF